MPALLSLNAPDAATANRVVEALCAVNGYQAQVPDGTGQLVPNPETKPQFAKRQVIAYLQGVVTAYERSQAVSTAPSLT